MRLKTMILAAALAVGFAGAAEARPDHHGHRDTHHAGWNGHHGGGNGHGAWNGNHGWKGRHRGWNHRRHCTTRWEHHHRVRRCW